MLRALVLILLVAAAASAADTTVFEARFVDETLRVDYNHTGHATLEVVGLDRVHRQSMWAGSRVHLVETWTWAATAPSCTTPRTVAALSRGSIVLGEWQTTGRRRGVSRTTRVGAGAVPKRPVEFALEARGPDG